MMSSFRSEPFLWIHLAGVAALPPCLALCWMGLGAGSPLLSGGRALFLVAVVGILPVLWMQLLRPFNIFSILAIALKPEQLTTQQRKILSLFKIPSQRVLAILTSFLLAALLWQIYRAAPTAPFIASFPSEWRIAGLPLAAAAFLLSNLFLQVPLSVIRVLVSAETSFAAIEPYPLEKIGPDFTTPGWQVDRILPPILVREKQFSGGTASIIEKDTSSSS